MRAYQRDLFDGRRKRRNPVASAYEAQEQEALFQWRLMVLQKHPELALFHAIPNGGWRHKAVAAALKRQGVLPGIPDTCLPVARQGAHGLYIELKRIGEGLSTTEDQESVIQALREQGYQAEVCEGWEEAKGVILDYLRVET